MTDIITREEQELLLDLLMAAASLKLHRYPEDDWPYVCELLTRAFRAGKRSGIKEAESELNKENK
jgi:hypothetical protein